MHLKNVVIPSWHLLIACCLIQAEEVNIDVNKIVHVTEEMFVGVTIDSGTLRRHWEHFDPKSQKLKNLASALAPCYLRVGGNDADFLIFQEDSSPIEEADPLNTDEILKWTKLGPEHKLFRNNIENLSNDRKLRNGYYEWYNGRADTAHIKTSTEKGKKTNFTMSAKMYDQLHEFVNTVGWSLIFDLNVLLRSGDSWDPTNAEQLMKYTVKKGYKMAGWELGNEPDIIGDLIKFTLKPEQLASDYKTFKHLIDRFPKFATGFVVGPAVAAVHDYYKRFMNSGGGNIVTAATFHQYYRASAGAKLENFIDPKLLNVLIQEVADGVNLTLASGSKAQVWLGETSSSYGGGAKGLSNRYVAAFMWLDKLGISAVGGLDVVLRQSFYGLNYSLVDDNNFDPLPDYWLSLLYKLLVGTRVLKVSSPSNTGHLRVYAHCTATKRSGYRAGSVVIYVLNLNDTDQTVTFPQFLDGETVHVYSMEPKDGDLQSQTVLLNGTPLKMVDDSTLPSLLPLVNVTTAPITVKALTYSFIVLPEVNIQVCL